MKKMTFHDVKQLQTYNVVEGKAFNQKFSQVGELTTDIVLKDMVGSRECAEESLKEENSADDSMQHFHYLLYVSVTVSGNYIAQ